MGMNLHEVEQFARKVGSQDKAESLVDPSHWSNLTIKAMKLTGTCAGTGSYDVSVDLSAYRFTCSCPSRKYPCKHCLALAMLWFLDQEAFAVLKPLVMEHELIRLSDTTHENFQRFIRLSLELTDLAITTSRKLSFQQHWSKKERTRHKSLDDLLKAYQDALEQYGKQGYEDVERSVGWWNVGAEPPRPLDTKTLCSRCKE